VGEWDRQTDRRTDIVPLHRQCSEYCADSANNLITRKRKHPLFAAAKPAAFSEKENSKRREETRREVKWREREVEENGADRETRCEEQRWRETEEKLKIERGKE